MSARRGLFVAPFDALADPRVVADLAAAAEAGGWEGFFVWDHLQYGDRVADIADVWTCCAAVAVLSGGRFVLGLGLGDDALGELSDFGDEPDPRIRGRMLDEGLDVLTRLLSGEPVDHQGEFYAASGDVGFRPAPPVPLWLAGRHGNRAPLRRAAGYDGFFVIGLGGPDDVAGVSGELAAHSARAGFDLVVDLLPDQDPAPWLVTAATWVLTRIGPYDWVCPIWR